MEEQSLMPDVDVPLRDYEVLLTVPLDDDRGELVPSGRPIPSHVTGAWMATQAVFSVPVKARTLMEAGTLGLAACGEWARDPEASFSVRPAANS